MFPQDGPIGMRVAALYDIHGNLPALEAVLDDVRRANVDRIVIGGDVLPGPMPREALDRVLSLDRPTQCIHGNGDRVVLAQMTGNDIGEVPEPYRDGIRWTARRLGADHQRALAAWPSTCRVVIDGVGDVLFCHATPRNDTEIFTRLTPDARLAPVFAGVNASMVICGHTHMPFDRTVGTTRVVNAGSVGMPFAAPAGAYWLLLGPDVHLRRTDYDYQSAADRIRATRFPQADDFAARHVLNPPQENDTLDAFSTAELK